MTPAAAASVGRAMVAYSTFSNTSKIYKTGNFLWNVGINTVKTVAQGTTLPQQGISLLLNGRPYTPLVHSTTLIDSVNLTSIHEGLEEGLKSFTLEDAKNVAKTCLKN